MICKKYMYDAGRKTCMQLMQDGFVHTYEEIFNLMKMNEKVREEAEHGLDKKLPKQFREDLLVLQYIEENLTEAEKAVRKGSLEDNYKARMKLGKYFHEKEGYHWLAVYFYQSSQTGIMTDVKSSITSLQRQALLEEDRGNTDIALKYLERALRLANKNSVALEDPIRLQVNEHLCRIYRIIGAEYLDKETNITIARKSKSLKYFKKAAKLAMMSENLENQAACHALLGKVMMKFNNDEVALESFQLYINLCQKCNNAEGMCHGHFAASEIFKRNGDLEKAIKALNMCQELAKETGLDTPFIFASISLGQIATAKRQYLKANECFEDAYRMLKESRENFSNKKLLTKLCNIMAGIGKAHLTFGHLVDTLQLPNHLSLPKILSWRNTGGPFTGITIERQDYLINLDETEKEDKEAELSEFIGKLITHELNKD